MIYRKRGRVSRWENGALIHVDEAGVAREEKGLFECEPAPPDPIASACETEDLPSIAFNVARAAEGVTVERIVLIDGHAAHEYGGRRWSDRTRRMHISLTHAGLRVAVDLASFDVAEVLQAVHALRRLDLRREGTPPRHRVAANVTAALLPRFVASPPSGVRIVQSAGGVDGYGDPVVEAAHDWPNWFRPSYRIRPQRVPMNLRIEAAGEAPDPGLPCAIALLGITGNEVRVLFDDGVASWPAVFRPRRILAVSKARVWYPYAAGSFGAEMML